MNQNNYYRILNKGLFTYIFFLLISILSIVIVHSFSSDRIPKNVCKSVQTLRNEGIYDTKYYKLVFFRLDNFTDTKMLQLAVSSDGETPVRDAMLNNYYIIDDNIFTNLKLICEDVKQARVESYGRYWHGYLVFLKPLLLFLTYPQIRVINYLLLVGLLFYILMIGGRRLGSWFSFCFGGCLFFTNFPMVPLSLQFSTCYYISFISIILLLSKPKFLSTYENVCIYFLLLGSATSFLDFLTAPILPLGLSLLTYGLINDSDMDKNRYKKLLLLCIFWAAGYSLFWSSKWVVGTLLTGHDLFGVAFGQADAYTLSDSVMNGAIDQLLISFHLHPQLFIAASLAFLLILALFGYYYSHVQKEKRDKYSWVLVIALIAPLWLLILKNHTLIHYWFSWRNMVYCLMCVFVFIYKSSFEKNHG